MLGLLPLLRLTFVSLVFLPAVTPALVQKPDLSLPHNAADYRNAVKKIFIDSYAAYKAYAFGHDDVSPISKSFSDYRNGWGASIVDGMSTMQIMGLNDLFEEAVEFSSSIDFSKSNTPNTVSVFETTIRYVAGLLSAYELSDMRYPKLLRKAQELTDKLVYAWKDGNAIPYGHLDFNSNEPVTDNTNIAEAGSLALEWMTLSRYTSDDKYKDLAEQALRHIATLPPPLPGLAAQGINPSNGQFVGSYVTWGGGSDSYFEYLIKYARLTNTDDHLFADTWHTAVDSSIRYLRQVSTVGDHVYLGDWSDGTTISVGSHLACFHGGNWLLGGKLLGNQTIVNQALDLVDACWNTYESTITGIGPEGFSWIPKGNDGKHTPGGQVDFYNRHGFYITAPDYILRPEVLESNFYAYRVTGDEKYYDRAVKAVDSFNTYLTSPSFEGYAGISDVDERDSPRIDDTESFWFAEVLKYLFLTFDDPHHISLDEYVFNTECHPFRAPKELPSYGTGALKREGVSPFRTETGPLPAVSQNPFFSAPTMGMFGNWTGFAT